MVEWLGYLECHDLDSWLDRHRKQGSDRWWQQIRSAVDWTSVLVLVTMPGAERSSVVRQEWLCALDRAVRLSKERRGGMGVAYEKSPGVNATQMLSGHLR